MAREVLFQRATKVIYREGDRAIKSFCKGYPKAEVLNEALINARIEEIGEILTPITLGVDQDEDGCWSITKEYIQGTTLEDLMKENPDKLDEYMEQMVDLQLMIHSKTCPSLGKLKDKMVRQISELEEVSPASRADFLVRLESMDVDVKLCHGDFQPNNIIVTENGAFYVLDWAHATRGNACADAARTYLLMCLLGQEYADKYMDLFCAKTETDRRYLQQWLPLVAATQLTKHRPEEADLLHKWVAICDY